MKIIIDTNIWISILIGHQSEFARRVLSDLRFDIYVCPQLMDELQDVAGRSKIVKYLGADDLSDLLAIINAFCHKAVIRKRVPVSSARDPKDLYLLSLAETIGADYIVSGDADLLCLGQHKQTQIIKLSDFKNKFFN